MASIRGTFSAICTAIELCGDPSHTRTEYPAVGEVARKCCRMSRVVARMADGSMQTIHKDGKFARELANKNPTINKPMTAGDASLPSVIATKLPWMAEKEALVKVLQELAFTKIDKLSAAAAEATEVMQKALRTIVVQKRKLSAPVGNGIEEAVQDANSEDEDGWVLESEGMEVKRAQYVIGGLQ